MSLNKTKLYYILLGIGIGTILSGALVISRPNVKYKQYTDEEIRELARNLGMISIKDSITIEDKKDNNKTDESNDTKEQDTESNEDSQEGKEVTKVTFRINKGDSSEVIINNLFKEGIIDNKGEFREIIMLNKAEKNISYGIFELEKGMDYEELIKILVEK